MTARKAKSPRPKFPAAVYSCGVFIGILSEGKKCDCHRRTMNGWRKWAGLEAYTVTGFDSSMDCVKIEKKEDNHDTVLA